MSVDSLVNSAIGQKTSKSNLPGVLVADINKILEAIMINEASNDMTCVCDACVTCTNAADDSEAIHLLKKNNPVEIGDLIELNKKDIELEEPFSGCKSLEDGLCVVNKTYIEGGEWKDVDQNKSQGKDKETLNERNSYMICTKGDGLIYFISAGQITKSYMSKFVTFMDHMEKQFGFDRRTVSILASIYMKTQEAQKDLPQKDRDWYFVRALSQMGGYNNKTLTNLKIESNAWRKGAGWAYEYKEGKKYFTEVLGLDEEDYEYIRQMINLQHLMSSNQDGKYSYDSLVKLKNSNEEDLIKFSSWKKNMESGLNKTLTDDEYIEYYKQCYNNMGDKGDFSHMLYTISANLIDKGSKVDNKWNNIFANELSWETAEERKKIAGWLGDAVYDGDENKVSFKNDDYVADLDSDNISQSYHKSNDLLDAMNRYYSDLDKYGADKKRAEEFLNNNDFDEVEKIILARINAKDENNDKEVTMEDIKNNDTYKDTYNFLEKLKEDSKYAY